MTGSCKLRDIVVGESDSRLGRLFRKHPDIRLINSRYNWHVFIRYAFAYISCFDTVLFLDDDIHFLDTDVAHDMYESLMNLEPYDIVSGWNTIWTNWSDSEIHFVPANLWTQELTQLTKTDTCGPGISMFNRQLLFDANAQRHLINWSLPDGGDMMLGLLTNMIWKGITYAMPLFGRAEFHAEHKLFALHERPNYLNNRFQFYKESLRNGYKPVVSREPLSDDSPEMQLIRGIESTVRSW